MKKYFHSAVLCLKEKLSFSTHSHVSLNLYVASFSFFLFGTHTFWKNLTTAICIQTAKLQKGQ